MVRIHPPAERTRENGSTGCPYGANREYSCRARRTSTGANAAALAGSRAHGESVRAGRERTRRCRHHGAAHPVGRPARRSGEPAAGNETSTPMTRHGIGARRPEVYRP